MKAKVFITDGIFESVMVNEDAFNSNLDIEIIDFDKNTGNEEL